MAQPANTDHPPAAGSPATGSEEGAQWYALPASTVLEKFRVDPAVGLSQPMLPPAWPRMAPTRLQLRRRRPAGRCSSPQYKSTMQIILVVAAVASIVIGEVRTGVAVLVITALNALGGLRQQGKAESAMNALQSMLKTSARVRRDGAESTIEADQVVVGDIVLLNAGDDVCADGRILQSSSLQIDESALTGESVPAAKSAEPVKSANPVLGDQTDMAFMNTPVTHGSGLMIVTGTGSNTAVGNISGMLKSAPTLKTPLTAQLDTLTLWIAGAAGLTIAIMFALGLSRGTRRRRSSSPRSRWRWRRCRWPCPWCCR